MRASCADERDPQLFNARVGYMFAEDTPILSPAIRAIQPSSIVIEIDSHFLTLQTLQQFILSFFVSPAIITLLSRL